MDIKRAYQIVIDLASENILEEHMAREDPETLVPIRNDQVKALKLVTAHTKGRQVLLKQVGYVINGTAHINHWGGGTNMVEMDPTTILLGKLTKDNLLRCINDGRFGVESINQAALRIDDLYEGGYTEYNREIFVVGRPYRQKLFCLGI